MITPETTDTHETVQFTADIALFALDAHGRNHVLTVTRRDPPYAGCIGLPGGYVNSGERSFNTAHRELFEETALEDQPLKFLTLADEPHRDPRGRVISAVYGAILPYMVPPTGGDDAESAAWIPARDLPGLVDAEMVAFDHAHLISQAYQLLRNP